MIASQHLKRVPEIGGTATAAAVAETVAGVIADIGSRGDAAVREYSDKFDKWAPEEFLLSPERIEQIVADVPDVVINDIKTVQSNVRQFAQHQRDSIQDRSRTSRSRPPRAFSLASATSQSPQWGRTSQVVGIRWWRPHT